MKGGRRHGAGRPALHNKVNGFLSVDIRRWAREGRLKPHNLFGWFWHSGDEETGSIGVVVTSYNSLSFMYAYSSGDNKKRQGVSFPVMLAYTRCHLGGERVWFVCPHCGRRVAHLYFFGGEWLCRRSLRLVYPSQSEDKITRILRRINGWESMLGQNREKPVRMSQRRYDQIVGNIERADARWCGLVLEGMGRLLG